MRVRERFLSLVSKTTECVRREVPKRSKALKDGTKEKGSQAKHWVLEMAGDVTHAVKDGWKKGGKDDN